MVHLRDKHKTEKNDQAEVPAKLRVEALSPEKKEMKNGFGSGKYSWIYGGDTMLHYKIK
jgi:hypothetical protein